MYFSAIKWHTNWSAFFTDLQLFRKKNCQLIQTRLTYILIISRFFSLSSLRRYIYIHLSFVYLLFLVFLNAIELSTSLSSSDLRHLLIILLYWHPFFDYLIFSSSQTFFLSEPNRYWTYDRLQASLTPTFASRHHRTHGKTLVRDRFCNPLYSQSISRSVIKCSDDFFSKSS